MHSSVEREYEADARYLVMATDPEAGGYDSLYDSKSRFEDNACTGTRPYATGLGRFRPQPHLALPTATALIKEPDGVPGAAIVLLVGAGIIAVGLAASRPWRWRSHPPEVQGGL